MATFSVVLCAACVRRGNLRSIANALEPAYAAFASSLGDCKERRLIPSMRPSHSFEIGKIRFGGTAPLFLIAGPCVIESEAHATAMAERLGAITSELGVPYIFKKRCTPKKQQLLQLL